MRVRLVVRFGVAQILVAFLVGSGILTCLCERTGLSFSESDEGKVREQKSFSKRGPIQEQGKTIWDYEIVITEREIKLASGAFYKVWAFGGEVPGPTLIAREGDWVRIHLIN